MGTDIFLYAERYIDGQWRFLGEMLENKYDTDGNNPYYPADLYNVRNYGLFAILAGIRNDLEEPFEPIAPRRGIPSDLSPELSSWYASFQDDEMLLYPGWLTLEELITFDWYGKRRKEYAIVDGRVAHLFIMSAAFPYVDGPEIFRLAIHEHSKGMLMLYGL